MEQVSITLGRAEDCTLVFDDGRMSSRHARLESLGGGQYRLTDLGSRNGTFVEVGGKLRRIDDEATVTAGQRIRFGTCEATVRELLEMAGIDARQEPPPQAARAPQGLQLIRCASCGSIKPKGADCPNPLCGQPTADAGGGR
jgi:pSer/pThr/pTyr-binding forkhead associated (FHA) protein